MPQSPIPPSLIPLTAAANCASAFLLLVQFVLLAITAVALHFAWRWLIESRRNLPEAMALLVDYVRQMQAGTSSTTQALVEPQVAVASRAAGLKAGVRALFTGHGSAKPR